jgi:hypothetical protein
MVTVVPAARAAPVAAVVTAVTAVRAVQHFPLVVTVAMAGRRHRVPVGPAAVVARPVLAVRVVSREQTAPPAASSGNRAMAAMAVPVMTRPLIR